MTSVNENTKNISDNKFCVPNFFFDVKYVNKILHVRQ